MSMADESEEKPKKCVIVWASIVLYIVVAFLTYGYVQVRRNSSADTASVAGVFWPCYWFGRGFIVTADAAVWLFEESPPPKLEH